MKLSSVLIQVQSPEIPTMPRELSWAIIVLLACVLAWVITRYTERIDKMLQRLDDAVDAIKGTLISHAGEIKYHSDEIKSNTERIGRLEANQHEAKTTRRKP